MCGRFALTSSPQGLARLLGIRGDVDYAPRYNVAPTQPILVVTCRATDQGTIRSAVLMRWGFIPSFVKDPKAFPLLFNARSESVAEKASFRNALRRRRCIVPADAFYEWQRTGSGKAAASQPFLCARADGAPFALAGLWESWIGPNGEEVDTACILTTAANGVTAAIHPRLPVVIEMGNLDLWLDPDERRVDAARALCRPPDEATLTLTPIVETVNAVGNDSAEVQRPVGIALASGAAPRRRLAAEQPSLF